jgi:OmpA-OmpF porin, OOP family
MKKALLLLFLLFIVSTVHSQNLIPNSDFETFTNCPSTFGSLPNATGWISPNTATPDYFNTCGTFGWGVPLNEMGWQQPHSGDGYVGLVIKSSGIILEERDYMQCQLLSPLSIGNTYTLTFFMSLSDFQSQFSSSSFGALFSTVPVEKNDDFNLLQTPQMLNDPLNFPSDKVNWEMITMSFVADSSYQYMTIGNFNNDANTATMPAAGGNWPRAYYYFDDIVLTIATGLNDLNDQNQVNVFPNPFSDNLFVELNNLTDAIIIFYDVTGKIVLKQSLNRKLILDTRNFKQEIYIYQIRNDQGILQLGKVIKR